jgi:hypothetical protein
MELPRVSAAPAASSKEETSRAVRFRAVSAKSKKVVGMEVTLSVLGSWRRRNGIGLGKSAPGKAGVYVSVFVKKGSNPSHDHPPKPRFNADQAEYSAAAGRLKISKLIAELPPRTFPLNVVHKKHDQASLTVTTYRLWIMLRLFALTCGEVA